MKQVNVSVVIFLCSQCDAAAASPHGYRAQRFRQEKKTSSSPWAAPLLKEQTNTVIHTHTFHYLIVNISIIIDSRYSLFPLIFFISTHFISFHVYIDGTAIIHCSLFKNVSFVMTDSNTHRTRSCSYLLIHDVSFTVVLAIFISC